MVSRAAFDTLRLKSPEVGFCATLAQEHVLRVASARVHACSCQASMPAELHRHGASDMQALIILTTALLRAASITEVHAVETLGASQG